MIGVKEIELLDAFCAFLDKKGIQYKREVRKRSYHNEGYCDVVIRSSDGRFMGIECKINGFGTLVMQVLSNRCTYHYNYALYPRVPKNIDSLKECGLILPVTDTLTEFKIHRKVKIEMIAYYCMGRVKYSKTERNWNENRVGRLLHASEIPEGYSKDHLKPTFEWVGKCKGKRFDSP